MNYRLVHPCREVLDRHNVRETREGLGNRVFPQPQLKAGGIGMSSFDIRGHRIGRRSLLQGMGVAAIGITVTGLGGCTKEKADTASTGEEASLNFYNWDTYIGETTLDDFQATSGIAVKMDLFDSNDVLFAKFRAGNPGYDVIVPSNDFVERMVQAEKIGRASCR